MVSYYLRREVRERMIIARDMALSDDRDWEAIANISAGLEVMFAVTGQHDETDEPEFLFVSNSAWQLTGYWPTELVGQNPSILQGPETNVSDAHAFMSDMINTGSAETKLANVRKNGDVYGCHILGCKAPNPRLIERPEYFAFFSECSLNDCQTWNPPNAISLPRDDQIKAC